MTEISTILFVDEDSGSDATIVVRAGTSTCGRLYFVKRKWGYDYNTGTRLECRHCNRSRGNR
jgi:hypothetical protein